MTDFSNDEPMVAYLGGKYASNGFVPRWFRQGSGGTSSSPVEPEGSITSQAGDVTTVTVYANTPSSYYVTSFEDSDANADITVEITSNVFGVDVQIDDYSGQKGDFDLVVGSIAPGSYLIVITATSSNGYSKEVTVTLNAVVL